jgi:hypothetical protein
VSAGLLLQYVVIALAVSASVGFVANQRFPASIRKLRVALALPLLREGRAAWMRAIGKAIAPAPTAVVNSCGGCSGCDTTPQPD